MPFFDKDGNEVEITAEADGVKDLVAAAVKEATSGLSANKDEILGEKKKLQEQLDKMGETWKGLDPEAVRNIMTRLESDEETKLLAEGKMDEVIERRTERLKADHARQLANLEGQLTEANANLDGAGGKVKKLMVEGQMRQAASELGLVPSAVEDALSRAMNVFSVGEDDSLVAENAQGTIYGKDGKTPITPAEWLSDMKEKAPHWFPAPSGGGAGGGNGKGGGAHTISRADARDVQKYQTAKAAAAEAGVPLQITA